jgi:hypothetical protein
MKAMLRAWAKGLLAMFTSRLAGAVLLLGLLAFGAHSVFAPARLPPLGSLGLENLGLTQGARANPLPIDADTAQAVRESARDAVQSGLPYLEAYLAGHPQSIPWINRALAGLAGVLLAASMTLRMLSPPAPQRGDMTITT